MDKVLQELVKKLAQAQNFIESPKSTADLVPQVKTGGKVNDFVGNIALNIAKNIVAKGVVDPSLDYAANAGRSIRGEPLMPYEQVKSPITRAGYQIATLMPESMQSGLPRDTKTNFREYAGNIGGIASPILDASTGSYASNAAKAIVPSGGAMNAIKQALVQGGVMGGSSGLSSSLDENRKNQDNLDYIKQILSKTGAGAATGAAITGAGAALGLLNKAPVTEKAPLEGRDVQGRFVKKPDETKWILDKQAELRRQGGFIDPNAPVLGSDEYAGYSKVPTPDEVKAKILADTKSAIQTGTKAKGGIDEIWNPAKPSLKFDYDEALAKGDMATVKKLEPEIPAPYREKAASLVNHNPLLSEAKNYRSAEEFVKGQQPIYHGTPKKFDKFNTDISEGNATWFTGDKKDIIDNTAGAVQPAGAKLNIMERFPKPGLKLATPEQADKLYTDQLIAEGYRGVKYPKGEYGDYEWTKLFNPNEDTITRSQLTDIWNQANKGTQAIGKALKSLTNK